MRTGRSMCLVLVMAVMAVVGTQLFAQGNIEGRIYKIDLRDQKTPVFDASQRGSQGSGGRWCRIDVEFETKGRQWLNEVEVRWLVAVNADELPKAASMPLNVTYTDVKEGRRNVCAYISPKFFERYMRSQRIEAAKISVYVELFVNGKRIARNERRGNSRMPDNWFTMNDKMQAFPTTLLPRYKTPFAFFDYDYYEVEKQQ